MAGGQTAARLTAGCIIDALFVSELLLMGTVTGYLAGLLGIGGGMIQVPFLTILLVQHGMGSELALKTAIATAMATIVFTSLASVRAHHARGAVRWDIARAMAPGILAGGLVTGAGLFARIKGPTLGIVFAVFVGYSATQMLLDRKPRGSRPLPGAAALGGVGVGIGSLSSLVGAGGAFLSVPFMTWCNVPIHHAVGTSAALGFPIALASTVGYVIGGWSLPTSMPGTVGYLYLPALAVVATASVLMAPLGARTAHAMNVRAFRRLFAVLLYYVAGYMAWRGFA
ncbi:MAG: sulfite exporter TauE/SafE family protein [Aquincola sp.]|nr:sulfite exporter TauE/SafE family protein [Aquincola sp.]MDH4288152.1 sulfite exporter TauE/SafE family protein [Aquincola sp.]MDH5329558.1 sulfite exporter TauE/SafE family protein [Aquincola sp.]